MIGAMLVAALAMRIALGDWQITDALVSASIVTAFPFLEWAIHVFILHWRPKHIGKLVIDPLLAHKHRQHHADPASRPWYLYRPRRCRGYSPAPLLLHYWRFRESGWG
ncbi:putative fatty acid hydroxylase [Mycobacterium xenopi 4042]|uniref:Putative fatty acid hydroxylase n=1 Tax=Mycobacterium xenopi 4042 TaxID=1299334 RepID=X8DKL3_MYCXE|nr:putative fatty acid hydroxylase [Mycobacterium xenopi 4042]